MGIGLVGLRTEQSLNNLYSIYRKSLILEGAVPPGSVVSMSKQQNTEHKDMVNTG
jgi:hypothetical protein